MAGNRATEPRWRREKEEEEEAAAGPAGPPAGCLLSRCPRRRRLLCRSLPAPYIPAGAGLRRRLRSAMCAPGPRLAPAAAPATACNGGGAALAAGGGGAAHLFLHPPLPAIPIFFFPNTPPPPPFSRAGTCRSGAGFAFFSFPGKRCEPRGGGRPRLERSRARQVSAGSTRARSRGQPVMPVLLSVRSTGSRFFGEKHREMVWVSPKILPPLFSPNRSGSVPKFHALCLQKKRPGISLWQRDEVVG